MSSLNVYVDNGCTARYDSGASDAVCDKTQFRTGNTPAIYNFISSFVRERDVLYATAVHQSPAQTRGQ